MRFVAEKEMKERQPNFTTKGLELALECDLATWRSYRYAQSITGATRVSTVLELRDSQNIGGMVKMTCLPTLSGC